MDARSRARLLSVGVLAVVFASGIVVGFAWDRQLDAAEVEALQTAEAEGPAAGEAEDAPAGTERRGRPMWESVDPTEAQRVRIDSIVDAYRKDVRDFHRESRQHYDEGMRALVVQTREAIMGVLDADQAARYDSLTSAWDARAAERARESNRN